MAAIWMSVSLGFLPALAFGTLRNGKGIQREKEKEFMVYGACGELCGVWR